MRYLKQLVLQGYKTFASRTEFVFDAGVTAIVGPNGSGKSNVADALRWVLGEQSYGTLRGKRTEDMIFSGSEQRTRMGMAHVALILDNSTGWLPIDFAEVEIARRAYRSGENEYYLNGNKVRLRDIAELLGSSGLAERTYTSIGQGLVDQALSQRPEERRKLFEEAAGITVYQSKRDQAASRLADTQTNLTRARDIISELTPRLRYLKGQARRAQEYQQLKRDLETHLTTWYGYRWRQALLALAGAKNRAEDAQVAAEEEADELNRLLEEVTARRAERAVLRDQLGEWHRASSGLHRQAETVQRELAVRAEQVRLWREQGDDLSRELGYLGAALEDGAQRLEAARAELREAREAHGLQSTRVNAAQQDLEARERQRQTRARALAQAQDQALSLKTQLAERRSRLAQLAERGQELTRSDAEQQGAAETAAKELASLDAQLRALTAKVQEGARELAALDTERQTHGQALAAAQDAERQAAEQLAQAQRGLSRLQDQLDLLERLRDEGAGLSSGVRAVMAAARAADRTEDRSGGDGAQKPRPPVQRLAGVLGTLGDLIEAPPHLDRALEAALGGRVQDVVVRKWEHAEAAVAFLKQNQAGRATFLPLDTLRAGRPADAPRAPGVIGLASELVRFDPAIRPAVELALNRTLIVEDLPTARGLLNRAGGATLVTLEGEIVRSSGSVTGGADRGGRDGGLLTRARTLRELPGQIHAAQDGVAAHEQRVAAAQQTQADARAALDGVRVRRETLATAQNRLNAEQNKVQLASERMRQTRSWHEERRKTLAAESVDLERRRQELQAAIEKAVQQLAERETQVETLRREVNELAADDLVGELARVRAEAAVSAGQLRSLESRARELSDAQGARAREIASKNERLQSLAAQQTAAAAAIDAQSAVARRLAAEIAAYAGRIDPAEARLAELEKQQRQSEAQERQLRDQVRYAQSRQSQADLAAQRAQDELTHLRGEIEKDLGLVELAHLTDTAEGHAGEEDHLVDSQPPLPLNGMVTQLPVVEQLPDGLDSDVRHLRAQIARLGPVNLEALNEFSEVEARFNFLTSQSADLEQAVTSLQEVIAELDTVMEREFQITFKAVAIRFKEEFVNLFGGGAAKLVMTDPDSPSTSGIEITARPPGKREQGLALLSGGERALTAAALIFSILKTRPTPFCVLDEVDAALDEANVGRFRDAIKLLAQQTQFILITHNRGTIEAADTIYGISMGGDNTSQSLSLKLNGRELISAGAIEA